LIIEWKRLVRAEPCAREFMGLIDIGCDRVTISDAQTIRSFGPFEERGRDPFRKEQDEFGPSRMWRPHGPLQSQFPHSGPAGRLCDEATDSWHSECLQHGGQLQQVSHEQDSSDGAIPIACVCDG
jgi:hypothetical protein